MESLTNARQNSTNRQADSAASNIGNKALSRGATDPRNMVRSSKNFIGDYDKEPWNLNGKKFKPTDVATEILKEVRANFVRTVDCDPSKKIGAVITVPAYFNNNQRTETLKAGKADYHKKRNIILKAAQKAKKELSGDSEESDIDEDIFDDYDLEMTCIKVSESELYVQTGRLQLFFPTPFNP